MSCRRLAAALVALAILLLYNGSVKAGAGTVSARSAVVIEQTSRRVLFEKNAHERLPMASTTKIMTALVALEKGNLSDVVKVSPNAAKTPGSSIYLKAGEALTLEQLLYGLMLQSGNDASVAIAEHVGGSVDGFLALMNAKVAELGLADTHFVSTHGLDTQGHYTSAYDLAVITAAAMGNADFRRIISTKMIAIPYDNAENGRYVRNTNRILWSYEGANGVKTGYTGKAGRCFVGAAEREGMQIISVVLNSGSIFEESAKLMDEAFAAYDMVPVVEPRVAFGSAKAVEGIQGFVRYGAPQKLVLPLNQEERGRVYTHISLPADLNAPVARGQVIGQGSVLLDGRELASFPVISLEADGRRTYLWQLKRLIEGFIWRGNGESGFRNIWPFAESPPGASARN